MGKKVYDTANFHHLVHTLALLAVPLCRRPALTGTLMIAGTSLFCGTIYYHALTEQKTFRKYTPYGGIILIMACFPWHCKRSPKLIPLIATLSSVYQNSILFCHLFT